MEKRYLINNIINLVIAITEKKTEAKGLCLLLGAGADIASGGKTFRNLKIDFLNDNGYDIANDIDEPMLTEYFDTCVEKFSEAERCAELDTSMRKYSTPSEGYELLVLLAELGYIDAIVTTNFDIFLEEAQNKMGLRPFDIFAPGVAVPKNFYKKRQKNNPIYLKLHGDLYGRYVSHLTKNEIEKKEYGTEFVELLTYILQNYTIISVGYGGYDNLIVDIFKNSIDTLNPMFWCDINKPNKTAPLVKLLEQYNKLNYVNCSFDMLLCELAGNILKNKDLPDTNPIFLPSIINAKINEKREVYLTQKSLKEEITRENLIKNFESFLINNNNLLFVHGKNGRGKTTLIKQLIKYYNEFTFIPIEINVCETKSILEYFAHALGYKTDVPFSLLYNFAKWCNFQNKSVIFIIDEFKLFENQNTSIKYIKELCDYLTIVKEYMAIKVVICIETESYKTLYSELHQTIYHTQIDNAIEVSKFSLKELSKIKKANTNSELYEIMCEPYILGMINIQQAENDYSLEKCIDEYILKNVEENHFALLNRSNLSLNLESIAKNSLETEHNIAINKIIIDFLHKLGVVTKDGVFIYEIFSEYYYYKYLKRRGYKKCIDKISSNQFELENTIRRSAYVRVLSDVSSTENVREVLELLVDLLNKNNTNYVTILFFETMQKIQKYKFPFLKNYLLNANLQENRIKNQLDFIWYTSRFASEDPFEILNLASKYKENSYDAFIIKHEYLKECLEKSIHEKNLNYYLDLVKHRLFHQDKDTNFLDLLYILTQWGMDTLSYKTYESLVNEFQHLFDKYIEKMVSNELFERTANTIKKYSYNILFNSGPDLEEKYNETIHDYDLVKLSKKVLYGEALCENDYLQILHKSNNINNSWTFLICNFITVISMQNDFHSTYNMLLTIPDKFSGIDLAKQIDFYLSSVFMSLYITQNDVFKNFNTFFYIVMERYERNLFEIPPTRMATLHRFSDEFELAFEDGFNPLAFYFYISPNECYRYRATWNNGQEYLKAYWSLCTKLEQAGDYKGILRIVHALGQMISIYPKEGFEALENIPFHLHEIIKRGVLRILKENYLRYPLETQKFITNTKFHISSEELLEIEANRMSYWKNRTFEQLHWARFFVNISKIKKKNVTYIFLENFLENSSYRKFIKNFFEKV